MKKNKNKSYYKNNYINNSNKKNWKNQKIKKRYKKLNNKCNLINNYKSNYILFFKISIFSRICLFDY